jgi:hypothetical protein
MADGFWAFIMCAALGFLLAGVGIVEYSLYPVITCILIFFGIVIVIISVVMFLPRN